MKIVHAQLFDGAGDEIDAHDFAQYTLTNAFRVAEAWGRGVLERADDPDAYVTYTATQSKSRPSPESLGIDTSKSGWLTEYYNHDNIAQ